MFFHFSPSLGCLNYRGFAPFRRRPPLQVRAATSQTHSSYVDASDAVAVWQDACVSHLRSALRNPLRLRDCTLATMRLTKRQQARATWVCRDPWTQKVATEVFELRYRRRRIRIDPGA